MATERAPRVATTHPHRRSAPTPASGPDAIADVLGLQEFAGNRAVTGVLQRGIGAPAGGPDDPCEREADAVARALVDTVHPPVTVRLPSSGAGQPLPLALRERFEAHLGRDLDAVRLHTGPRAHALTGEMDARAVTVGTDIHLDAGEPGPDPGAVLSLLAHEVAHTLQPGRVARPKGKGKKLAVRRLTKITIFVDRDIVVLEVDGGRAVTLPLTYNGHPAPGHHIVSHGTASPRIGGVANVKGYVAEWTSPPDATYLKADTHTVTVVSGRPGPSGEAGADNAGTGGTGGREGAGAGTEAGTGAGAGKIEEGAEGGTATGIGGPAGSGGTPGGDPAATRLTPEEEAVWRRIAELSKGAGGTSSESPAELVRLFQVLRSVVVDPTFGTEGESWMRFARFLDRNRDKIEGYLRSGPHGTITTEALEKILTEYGRFVATTPDEGHPGQLETEDDFDREFRYDPGWARLSAADRRLLVEYARATPGEIGDKKVDFVRLTGTAKMIMALKVADTTLLGSVGDAAMAAFSDPRFWVTLVVIMGIYVGLWLTPDPSWVTKIAAGVLTAVLLAQFTIDDIYGFAVAWSDLSDACTRATTLPELKAAGDAFLTRIGPIGFDIMMFIVMWRVGKLAGPKLSKIGAQRATVRAKARVAAVEAKPGSGVAAPRGAAPDPLAAARRSGGSSPAQVLDALEPRLPEAAREGLSTMRRSGAGDAGTLKQLEKQSAAGNDLAKFLTDKAVPAEAASAVKAELTRAKLDLARARLVEAETLKDPQLRETVRDEQIRTIREVLEDAGSLKAEPVRRAIAARDLAALKNALKAEIAKLGRRTSAHETKGAIGEALQRAQLRARYAGKAGVRFLSNLALVRKLGRFRSLREWRPTAEARLRAADPNITDAALRKALSKEAARLFEKDGQVWESVGELDTMVVEPGTGGKLRPLELTEVKSGAESPGEAAAQLERAAGVLEQIAAGTPEVRVFELQGKKQLGGDLTDTLDLSGSGAVPRTTFGPAGEKVFGESLGYSEQDLTGVAQSVLRNLPPEKPATVPPVSWPKQKDTENKDTEAAVAP